MAEQFLRAYHIKIKDLLDIVGCKDMTIIKSAMKNKYKANDVNGLIEEWGDPAQDGSAFGLRHAFDDIIKGNLDKKRAYEYIRTAELLFEVKGELLDGEAVFPGRGWQEIGKYFTDIGLPTLGKIWCKSSFTFPWKERDKFDQPNWPLFTIVNKETITELIQELEKVNIAILKKHKLPERLKGLEDEIAPFVKTLKKWLKNSDKDLVLLLDGQQ